MHNMQYKPLLVESVTSIDYFLLFNQVKSAIQLEKRKSMDHLIGTKYTPIHHINWLEYTNNNT